ncbi:hypothetical protein GCM10010361_73040 [Streptomyces olivaceiscleroticus]|uniref:Uncharacterized protein n=2 Tax=Streptomyces olivaceiscleroticus TaxID=68245 RepID=A0ABP3LCK4_9ACTN
MDVDMKDDDEYADPQPPRVPRPGRWVREEPTPIYDRLLAEWHARGPFPPRRDLPDDAEPQADPQHPPLRGPRVPDPPRRPPRQRPYEL